MHYFLIIALQGFCVYHAIKNKKEYHWFFVIIFLPVIGGLIYLITQIFNEKDLGKAQGDLINAINPSKKINDLKKQLDFADTFQNRILLADAFLEIKEYQSAIKEYEIALNNNYEDNFEITNRLIQAYYQTMQYDKVVSCAHIIKNNTKFKGSNSQFLFGLALEEMGDSVEAEKQLRLIDQRYSNYGQRYELAKFLIKKNKTEDAKEILNEILIESKHMTKHNRNMNKEVIYNVKKQVSSL